MTILFGITIICYLIYLYIMFTKSLHMLQQNRYNRGNKYLNWIIQNIFKVLFNEAELLLISILLCFVLSNVRVVIIYGLLIILLIVKNVLNHKKSKLPLVNTGRIKRLTLTFTLINIMLLTLLVKNYHPKLINNYYVVISLYAYLIPWLVIGINFVNRPIEKTLALMFKRKATNKLKQIPNMEVIGITGSYGKTSSKNILNDILNIKYNVFPTPKNYNTPFGLMITINEYLDKYNDFFIAEMGACRKGEIKELCNLVKPKYGILTKIGLSHLETFGSEKNIQKTKFELIESLPSDGLGILNGDDEKQCLYQIKNKVEIKTIGINNKDVDCLASNISLDHKGSTFTVTLKGDSKKYQFKTKLLGKANIYNILAGIALGQHLGIPMDDLIKAVWSVKPVEHRLELKPYYDMFLIDDAYNSNPDGAKMALEVLKSMPGTRVIMTPGMIELGDKDQQIHFEFGQNIADCADKVILVGENKTKDIYKGLISENYKKENIYIINDVMDGFELIKQFKGKKQVYTLIENDLPDSFTEKKEK